ncbi:hypothetical protein [Demequina iriomotensis]|uniref:hypothetical protein n=1 Tax=Demequina iriomotensis TaxID=1536641 RepID=UPI0007833BC6|nr:hypothetical protein [Demequina iriomotensis]
MNSALVIGVIAGAVVLVVLVVVVIVFAVVRRQAPPPQDPGRGPTGQHPDPLEGTPSDTSIPHWDRRIDPNEGPQ